LYKEPANSPFVPKEQRDIADQEKPQYQRDKSGTYIAKDAEPPKKYPPTGGNPVVDLKVWQSKPPPKKPFTSRDKIPPVMYMPMNVPTTDPYTPPQFHPTWPYYYPQTVAPVVKQYSINNGPFVNYSTLSYVKEDALPEQLTNTSNTLGERINLYNFVRSVFIKHHDGEDINLDGKGKNSLLSYLKFMELNPFSCISNPNNPYIGLPDDMLLYRSCYPIRYNQSSNTVACAPNSIGMNIRIYKLNNAEYKIKKLKEQNFYDYDVWREIAYYEYVREHIIKRKTCPHFALLYCYYISEKCNVDFNKVKMLKHKGSSLFPGPERKLEYCLEEGDCPPAFTRKAAQQTVKKIEEDLKKNSGKGLVALTEGPTYNLYGWASKKYQSGGNSNIHQMINSGYHKSEIWLSVLFQLTTALWVLQLNGIAFDNFSLEDNVYIKDITGTHDNVVMYWKYKINEYDYYIPNYGYLVMIDSNFKDKSSTHGSFITGPSKKFKIISNIFKDGAYDQDTINNKCFEAFKNAFDLNSFTKSFTNFGGTKPPEDVLTLIRNINDNASSANADKDISSYIHKHMRHYLNNRVGTFLTELENKNVKRNYPEPFKPGQIVVYEEPYETYQFVVFVKQNVQQGGSTPTPGPTATPTPGPTPGPTVTPTPVPIAPHVSNGNLVTVLTKRNHTDKDIIEKTVDRNNLHYYFGYESILQNYKPMEAKLSEEELLETYIIGK
jgi:hypothetical protein